MKNRMSPTKILIFSLALIAIAFISWTLFLKIRNPLKVVSVLPGNGAVNVDLNFSPLVKFNRSPKNISIAAKPDIDYSLQLNKNTATLTLNQPLQPKTEYSLTVVYKKKNIFSWSFTTRNQDEHEVIKEEIEMSQKLYPLINFVPYETKNFSIRYEAPLFLRVTIKKGNAKLIKKEVLNWIRSKGVDPASHKIKWLTPGP